MIYRGEIRLAFLLYGCVWTSSICIKCYKIVTGFWMIDSGGKKFAFVDYIFFERFHNLVSNVI